MFPFQLLRLFWYSSFGLGAWPATGDRSNAAGGDFTACWGPVPKNSNKMRNICVNFLGITNCVTDYKQGTKRSFWLGLVTFVCLLQRGGAPEVQERSREIEVWGHGILCEDRSTSTGSAMTCLMARLVTGKHASFVWNTRCFGNGNLENRVTGPKMWGDSAAEERDPTAAWRTHAEGSSCSSLWGGEEIHEILGPTSSLTSLVLKSKRQDVRALCKESDKHLREEQIKLNAKWQVQGKLGKLGAVGGPGSILMIENGLEKFTATRPSFLLFRGYYDKTYKSCNCPQARTDLALSSDRLSLFVETSNILNRLVS